ncbi:MAG: DNA recombination protein RmuC [Planctomycetes bacterium]|nr:DNA recombination protein RmuC [Planctomycetota bacterium]MCH8118375.1 DNA recombination protein RmuC [Planctomycetota bacterium]
MEYALTFAIGLICGCVLVFFLKHKETKQHDSAIMQKEGQISQLQEECTKLTVDLATLSEQQKTAEEKLAFLNDAKEKLSDAFKALSAEALKNNNTQFLELAKANLEKFQEGARGDIEKRKQAVDELVKPLKDSLKNVDDALRQIGKDHSGVREKIESLLTSEAQLKKETANLVSALRRPTVGGLWGQMQLRNVVELAGMLQYCDFMEQKSVTTETGRLQPDMVIRLPNKRMIVVDSKVALDAYIQATETDDNETRRSKLKEHAARVRTHISNLGSKGYWEQFQPGPEYVVLFLPGEVFFSAALQEDPHLIEFGVQRRVWLSSPTTLIALLRGIAYDWKQKQLAESAQIIGKLGNELYDRVRAFANHLNDIRKGLDNAVDGYNKAVGSFESRILVTARRFRELGAATGDEIQTLQTIDKTTRMIQAPEAEEGQNEMNNEGNSQEPPVKPGAK